MSPIKALLKNINVLNLLLLAMAIFLFLKFNDSLNDKKINFTIFNPKEVLMETEEKAAAEKAANYTDYAVIAEKNLFHPQRKMNSEKAEEQQQLAKPDIILYGTIISDEKKTAYVEDRKSPYSTAGRGKRQIAVNEGGMIAGYKLAKVNADSIVLVRGEDKITITLNIQKEKKPGEVSGKTTVSGAMPDSTAGQNPSILPPQARPMQPSMPPLPPTPARPVFNPKLNSP